MTFNDRIDGEDQLRDLYDPQAILPEQFFRDMHWRASVQAEHRLLVAILEDAIGVCLRAYKNPHILARKVVRDAEAWIESTDGKWVFSFERVCEALRLDADHLRQGLCTLRRRALEDAIVPEALRNWLPTKTATHRTEHRRTA